MARILVVDDSAFQRKRILGMVERLGHETIEASGGREALEVILGQLPDCVLLDLLMAHLGGIETLQQLQQRGLKIPVVVMTADVQETIRRQCLELGAVDVLHKPPRFEDIEAVLGKHIAEGDGDAMRLTARQTDVLQELVNIGVGNAAGMLHDMTRSPIGLNVPVVKVVTPRELKVEMARGTKGKVVAVQMPFTGPFAGVAQIIFASQVATEIITLTTALLSDEERKVFDIAAVREETLTEIGNVAATGVMRSIGNVLGKPFKLFPPHFVEESIENLLDKDYPNPASEVLFVQTGIKIADRKIEGQIRGPSRGRRFLGTDRSSRRARGRAGLNALGGLPSNLLLVYPRRSRLYPGSGG